MKAFLKNYRQSPRKVRLVADLIRGKKVDEAEVVLDFTAKRATSHFKKLLSSATANAKQNFGIERDNLYIKEVQVNKGVTLKRWRARARGSAFPINKRSCHITLILAEQELKDKKIEKPGNIETKTKKTEKAVAKPKKTVEKTAASTKTKAVKKKEVKAVKKVAPKAKTKNMKNE